jgi:hypothetical protein
MKRLQSKSYRVAEELESVYEPKAPRGPLFIISKEDDVYEFSEWERLTHENFLERLKRKEL